MSRRKLRGRKLDDNCFVAKTTTNEYGCDDKRIFCYGLMDSSTETHLNKCIECNAFVTNAGPPKGDNNENQ